MRDIRNEIRVAPASIFDDRLRVQLYRRIYGDDHPATADALTWHALAQERLGRYDVALAAVTESLAIRERALGADHPRTVLGRYQLGVLTANADRREEAVPIFREVVERRWPRRSARRTPTPCAR